MIRCFLPLLSAMIFCSCRSTSSRVITPKEMQQVLIDMVKAGSLAQEITLKDSAKKLPSEVVRLSKDIFSIHHITDAQFEMSYTYYLHHPDIMAKILDSMSAEQTRAHNQDTFKNTKLIKSFNPNR